jgi:hypothetical protein
MMYASAEITGFVEPGFAREPMLNRPLTSPSVNGTAQFLSPDDLGSPIYVRRSRMSDGRRFIPDSRAEARCRDIVATSGGAEFFRCGDWRMTLSKAAAGAAGRWETDEERAAAIRDELVHGRELLDAKLAPHAVRHVALPWGIAGDVTRSMLASTGHATAFAERPLRRRGVRAGDDRYGLMRLNGKFLTCLPGKGRTWFFRAM